MKFLSKLFRENTNGFLVPLSGTDSFTNKTIVSTAKIPGIIARMNVHLNADRESFIPKPINSTRSVIIANTGPATAPVLSIALSKPYDFPLILSSTDEAINASLGAVLIPLPTRSNILTIIISHAEATIPVNGLIKDDIE